MARLQLGAAPANPNDAATKAYVDSVAAGLSQKASCRLGTIAALPTNAYVSGVLTGSSNGALSVDGTAVAVNDRILVKNEAAQANNGIYTVTATGGIAAVYVLTRSTDMDQAAEIPGAITSVEIGTNAGTIWEVDSAGPFTVGTTAIVWTPSVQVGTGLTRTGNTISLADTAVAPGSYTNTSLTVDQQGRLTAASTGSAGAADPNATLLASAFTR